MAFDFTKLTGYREDMTADEKLALLETYETPAPDDAEAKKWKAQFDRTASDLAAANKALKAKMTEDEQKEAERAAAEAAIKVELESLRKDKTVTEHKAQYLSLGYDETLAGETAKAFADGDLAKVFANQKVFVENLKKAERAAALADGGGGEPPAGKGATKDEKEKQEVNALRQAAGLPIIT